MPTLTRSEQPISGRYDSLSMSDSDDPVYRGESISQRAGLKYWLNQRLLALAPVGAYAEKCT